MAPKKDLPQLSRAEWTVMKKAWQLKKTNVREVYEELKDTEEWAYNTIRTMMERLRQKGYLEGRKVGNTTFYRPLVSRRKIARTALDSFADRVFDGAIGPIVSYLIEKDRLSEKEMDDIKRMLEEKEDEK